MNLFRIGFVPKENFCNSNLFEIQWLGVFCDSFEEAYDDLKSLSEHFNENVYFIKSLLTKKIYSYKEFLEILWI